MIHGYENQNQYQIIFKSRGLSPHESREAPQPIAPSMEFKIVMTTAVMNPDQQLY
jgi:hypothetical protein